MPKIRNQRSLVRRRIPSASAWLQPHQFIGRDGLATIALTVLIWLAFGQTVRFGFVNYDDQNYVYQNPDITAGLSLHAIKWSFTHIHSQNWHPLTTLSHMLDCQLFGLHAGWHHATNVLLHSVAVILLFCFLRRTTDAFWQSLFVAAVFAIHPLRAESVAWISERKDVLSGVFFMLTLISYANFARKPPSFRRYALLIAVFAVSLLTKPMLVTTPFVLLLVDIWPLRRLETARRLLLEKVPLLLLSAASCVATLKAQGQYISSADVLPLGNRLANAGASYLTYMAQMVWPDKLTAFYPLRGGSAPLLLTLVSGLSLLAITLLVFIYRRRQPYLFTGWLWYLVMLVPVIGVVQVGWQQHADRYTYLPSIGLVVAVTWSVASLGTSRPLVSRLTAIGAGAGILLLLAMAWKQTSYWRDSETLWTHALAVTSNNDVAENNLGILLQAKGRIPEAIVRYERAVAIRPTNNEARGNLANALLFMGRRDEAVAQLREMLELQPDNIEARNTMGAVFFQEGKVREAVAEWEKVLAAHPQNGNAQANLAWVLATSPDATLRDAARALELAQHALQISGGANAALFRTLAAAYAENGRFQDACQAAERGLQLATKQGNSALMRDFEMNIAAYRAGFPVRERSSPSDAAQVNGT